MEGLEIGRDRGPGKGARSSENGYRGSAMGTNAAPQRAVMPRESGASSTPRMFASITDASEYWIARWSLSSGAHSRDPVADDDGRERDVLAFIKHTFAISRRDTPELCMFLRLENQRAQGKPGARCTRSRACRVESTRVSHHRSTGTPGLPCAMVLTAYFALSPVTGLVCHRRR
jgi:hypothetical protein